MRAIVQLSAYLVAAFALVAGPSHAATIVNGSLSGPLGLDAVPPGWTIARQSPDTNDVGHIGDVPLGVDTPSFGILNYAVAPSGPSPDGGTWVRLGAELDLNVDGAPFQEAFGQTISGLTVGASYELSWYASNFGAIQTIGPIDRVADGPDAITALLDGALIGAGDELALGPDWFLQSVVFTALAPSQFLQFELKGSDARTVLNIDGVALARTTSPVPLPASAPLLAVAIAIAAGASRLRRRRLGQ